jgi:hypothetical protein
MSTGYRYFSLRVLSIFFILSEKSVSRKRLSKLITHGSGIGGSAAPYHFRRLRVEQGRHLHIQIRNVPQKESQRNRFDNIFFDIENVTLCCENLLRSPISE